MKVLVINSGSSSVKYSLFRTEGWSVIGSGHVGRIGDSESDTKHEWETRENAPQFARSSVPAEDHEAAMNIILKHLRDTGLLDDMNDLAAIGHRVVHGGSHFHSPVIVDNHVIEIIRDLIPLAPLHNPGHIAGIEVARKVFANVPSVAVFDTAFHQTMPPESYRYALPKHLYTLHAIRRYGFHGISYSFLTRHAAYMLEKPPEECNLICLHLGSGTSACAIRQGESFDTSMGMTPLEGLVMGTRSGDIDPAILIYIAKTMNQDADQLNDLLNKKSGLLGICGVSDWRDVEEKASTGNERAKLAIGLMVHRLKKYIGAYYALLGQVDAIVFSGGIGENSALLRAETCAGLEMLGIELDEKSNSTTDVVAQRDISAEHAKTKVFVIPTNEEREIARQSMDALGLNANMDKEAILQ